MCLVVHGIGNQNSVTDGKLSRAAIMAKAEEETIISTTDGIAWYSDFGRKTQQPLNNRINQFGGQRTNEVRWSQPPDLDRERNQSESQKRSCS
jgi:hypothetical protein